MFLLIYRKAIFLFIASFPHCFLQYRQAGEKTELDEPSLAVAICNVVFGVHHDPDFSQGISYKLRVNESILEAVLTLSEVQSTMNALVQSLCSDNYMLEKSSSITNLENILKQVRPNFLSLYLSLNNKQTNQTHTTNYFYIFQIFHSFSLRQMLSIVNYIMKSYVI